jgi:membrane protein
LAPEQNPNARPRPAIRDDDRGRAAAAPTEIPPRGWKDIAWRVYAGISEDRIVTISAGVTFFVLLAIFPGIAGLIALYGLFADPAAVAQHLNALSGVLPQGGMQVIGDQIQRVTSQPPQRLGFALFLGLAISIWSANGGMKAMFDALNAVYRENEARSFIRLNAVSLGLTLGAIVFVIAALVAMTVVPVAADYLGLSSGMETILRIGRWPLLLIIASLAIAVIYRYGPSRDKAKWRWITPGSVLAAVLWLILSLAFSWYAENFGSYNKTYGSLGAVVGFMTWLWLSTIVILLGAKLNAEIEHQAARDSTEGLPHPLGERGAKMADAVAGDR